MLAFFLLQTSPNRDPIDQTGVIVANALKKAVTQVHSSSFPLSRENYVQVSGGRTGVSVGREEWKIDMLLVTCSFR